MASNPALLNFSFDSNYTAGCYRIASRIQGSGDPYVITAAACTPFVPPTLSVPCTAQIPITVDDETCDAVTYEGYVQPCCQDEESLDGRVAFTVTFTPNPACKSYLLTCHSSGVSEVLVDTPGTGYTPGPNVPVNIVDPAGTLATAECIVEDGGVKTFTLTSPGVGGTPGTYTASQGIDGTIGPVHAYFDYTIGGGGTVTSVTLSTGNPAVTGSGYSVADTVLLSDGFAPGNEPVITIDSVNTGEILFCTVLTAGSGYTGPTTATLPAAGLEVAPVLSVVNTLCNPTEYFGIGCDDDITPLRPDVALGATVQICRKGDVGAPPANMSIVEGGCCADPGCETITITAADPSYTGNIWYVDCCSTATESPTSKIGGGIDPDDLPLTINYMIGSLVFYPAGSESLLTISAATPYTCP